MPYMAPVRAYLFAEIRRTPYLVSYWRLNEGAGATTALDYSARNSLPAFYAAPSPAPNLLNDRDPLAGSQSVKVSNLASVLDASQLRLTAALSVEAIISPVVANHTATLVGKRSASGAVAAPYSLALIAGVPTLSVGNGTTSVACAAPAALAPGVTHLAATLFRGTLSLYVDGVLVATSALGSQGVADAGQPLLLGGATNQSSAYLLSDVAVHEGALSSRRVARHAALAHDTQTDPAHYVGVDPPVLA